MKKQYPTDQSITFLIADDIREEVGNKLTILGYTGGGDLIVERPDNLPEGAFLAFQTLSFLFVFADGGGDFSGVGKIIGPDGKKMLETAEMKAQKIPDGPMKIMFKFAPFVYSDVGSYKCTLTLDANKEYTRSFKIAWAGREK